LACSAAGERKGRRRESRLRRRAGEVEKKKKGRGREEADRWGPVVSESTKKKKRETAWAGAGRSWWAGRPAGPKGKEVPLFFFLFLFQTFSNSNFFFSNSNQILSNFSQKFYKLFRSHTSNQKLCKVK
jgi:hypothetical protein